MSDMTLWIALGVGALALAGLLWFMKPQRLVLGPLEAMFLEDADGVLKPVKRTGIHLMRLYEVATGPDYSDCFRVTVYVPKEDKHEEKLLLDPKTGKVDLRTFHVRPAPFRATTVDGHAYLCTATLAFKIVPEHMLRVFDYDSFSDHLNESLIAMVRQAVNRRADEAVVAELGEIGADVKRRLLHQKKILGVAVRSVRVTLREAPQSSGDASDGAQDAAFKSFLDLERTRLDQVRDAFLPGKRDTLSREDYHRANEAFLALLEMETSVRVAQALANGRGGVIVMTPGELGMARNSIGRNQLSKLADNPTEQSAAAEAVASLLPQNAAPDPAPDTPLDNGRTSDS